MDCERPSHCILRDVEMQLSLPRFPISHPTPSIASFIFRKYSWYSFSALKLNWKLKSCNRNCFMASMKDLLFPSSTRTLKTARKQRFEEHEPSIFKPHRASRCHTLASVCQRFSSTNTEKQSQRFTWISIFGFLLNLLTSILDPVTVFVCSESKVLKHNELHDHTWNRLLTTTECTLTSWAAFLMAFATSFYGTYD